MARLLNLAPLPVVHTQLYALLARALYDAMALGVFEAFGKHSLTTTEIAEKSNLNERALTPLLRVLVAAGYLKFRQDRFRLTRLSRKWLLIDSPDSVRDHLLFMREMWHWHDHVPHYLRTGEGLNIHDTLTAPESALYRRGMASTARFGVAEIGRKTPLPPHPTAMLDIGGSHGQYADWFCQQHPTLEAEVLDLPEVLEGVGPPTHERLRFVAGDALTYSFSENRYDLIFMSQVSHHFTASQNEQLVKRVAKALKPGGYFVIVDLLREEANDAPDICRSLVSLFFGLTSAAGLWSGTELQGWQRAAGLQPQTPKPLLSVPGSALLAAQKSVIFSVISDQ
ncbi:MAG: methyltransferase domain-containing protein [Cytophagaceae bacterium]|nr:methyltransferase domain-containing protein [Cytophagaceae bacterium]